MITAKTRKVNSTPTVRINTSETCLGVTLSIFGVKHFSREVNSSKSEGTISSVAISELSVTPWEMFCNDWDLSSSIPKSILNRYKIPSSLGNARSIMRRLGGLNWLFFNRLNVPLSFVPQNAAILLMVETCKYADKNNCGIVDALNPYGRLDYDQLVTFNKLFGFFMIKDGLMIRLPRAISFDFC